MFTTDLMLSGGSILLGSNEPKLLSIKMPTIEIVANAAKSA